MKNNLLSLIKSFVLIIGVVALISGASRAAFTSTAINPGNTFTTGTAELKLLDPLTYGDYDPGLDAFIISDADCTTACQDSVPGFTFTKLAPGWTEDEPIKLVNAGSLNLIVSALGAQTSGNPDLANWITVQLYGWRDDNVNGVIDPGEKLAEYGNGPYTLAEWFAATPFTDLGQIDGINEVQGFIFTFAVDSGIPGSFQGTTIGADFTFNGTTVGATQ